MTCAKKCCFGIACKRTQEAAEGIVRLDIYLFGAFIFGSNFRVNLAAMVREEERVSLGFDTNRHDTYTPFASISPVSRSGKL